MCFITSALIFVISAAGAAMNFSRYRQSRSKQHLVMAVSLTLLALAALVYCWLTWITVMRINR